MEFDKYLIGLKLASEWTMGLGIWEESILWGPFFLPICDERVPDAISLASLEWRFCPCVCESGRGICEASSFKKIINFIYLCDRW